MEKTSNKGNPSKNNSSSKRTAGNKPAAAHKNGQQKVVSKSKGKTSKTSPKPKTPSPTHYVSSSSQNKLMSPRNPMTRSKLSEQHLLLKQTRLQAGFQNPTTSNNELLYLVRDFVDYSYFKDGSGEETVFKTIFHYFTPPSFTSMLDTQYAFGKILKCNVYALPRFNFDSINSTNTGMMVLFAVPCISPGQEGGDWLTAQKTTFLTPTSVYDWVHVGGWSFKNTFKDGLSLPKTDDITESSGTRVWNAINMFRIQVVDPDTCQPFVVTDTTAILQLRVDVYFEQTAPLVIERPIAVYYTENFSDEPSDVTASSSPVLLQFLGASSRL